MSQVSVERLHHLYSEYLTDLRNSRGVTRDPPMPLDEFTRWFNDLDHETQSRWMRALTEGYEAPKKTGKPLHEIFVSFLNSYHAPLAAT